jgi:DegT/DnrJ/EryC1/StrS aminotransferase family
MPADHAHATDPSHRAATADRAFLDEVCAAVGWWGAQRTWRVTSSHTGGGVIAAFEEAVARQVGPDAHALALPSATAALKTALEITGVGSGARVGVPALDWTATGAVLRTLGARAFPLPVVPDSDLLDVVEVARRELALDLDAVVMVHLHGLTGDGPALRRAYPGLPIIEDAAQAWAACYPDGSPVGSAADACAFSFGAAKSPSAGELGCLVTRTRELYRNATALTQHPTRQWLAGVACPRTDQVMTRVAPVAALLGAFVIQRHAAQIPALRQAADHVARVLRDAGLPVLTDPAKHAPGIIAVRAALAGVRRLLPRQPLPGGLVIGAVDRADVNACQGYTEEPALAAPDSGITVITVTVP